VKHHILCFGLVLVSSLSLAGGSIAGNGGGIAEKQLDFAFDHLEEYLDFCLGTPLCGLNDDETKWAQAIRLSHSEEKSHGAVLQFRPGHAMPRFFSVDGRLRVAKTGDHIGDPIYLNVDLLYVETENKMQQAIDLPMAISILVHELGHHHGISDHDRLDRLGTKLQTFFLKQSLHSEIWNGDVVFTVLQFNPVHRDDDKNKLTQIDQILISYDSKLLNLTQEVLAAVRCPQIDERVRGLRIYNLHEDRGVRFDAKSQVTLKPLTAWYVLSCEEGKESDHGDLKMLLRLKRNQKTNKPEFILQGSEFKQVSCGQGASAC
jgi:hypothetical protein